MYYPGLVPGPVVAPVKIEPPARDFSRSLKFRPVCRDRFIDYFPECFVTKRVVVIDFPALATGHFGRAGLRFGETGEARSGAEQLHRRSFSPARTESH